MPSCAVCYVSAGTGIEGFVDHPALCQTGVVVLESMREPQRNRQEQACPNYGFQGKITNLPHTGIKWLACT